MFEILVSFSNGFASGPPFARKPNREGRGLLWCGKYICLAPWSTMDEQKKRQQIELIDKEIDVMAEKALVGMRTWRPKWIQRFATKNWMLLWLCWFCTIQGIIVNGLVPSTISTIERRFHLSTSTIGRIMQVTVICGSASLFSSMISGTSYSASPCLTSVSLWPSRGFKHTNIGGRHSKPLALAIGLLLMATGSFMFSTPHLIADSYTNTYNDDDAGLSRVGRHVEG